MVSGTPEAPGTSSRVSAEWNVCWLVNENPGDQVIDGVVFTGEGVSDSCGKFCVMSSLDRSCERLPPMVSVPQSNRLSKFSDDARLAVARNGLTVLVWITWALVA